MTTIYCCYNNTTFIDSHNTSDAATNCINNRKRIQANINLLLAAGVPNTIASFTNNWIFLQLNNILGITSSDIDAEVANVTTYSFESKTVS